MTKCRAKLKSELIREGRRAPIHYGHHILLIVWLFFASLSRGAFFFFAVHSNHGQSQVVFLPSASLSIFCLQSLQLKLCTHDPLPDAWSTDAHCIPLPVKPEFFSTLVAWFIFLFPITLDVHCYCHPAGPITRGHSGSRKMVCACVGDAHI